MSLVGIMQGRLLPPFKGRFQAFPAEGWQLEFSLARQAGLYCIEWIFEEPGQEQNPISTDGGIAEMEKLSSEHGVLVRSVCADYYMTQRLISSQGDLHKKTVSHFLWLAERIKKLGVRYVVLPFVDSSSLASEAERDGLVIFLGKILPSLEGLDLEVHLETDFPPKIFSEVMERIDHPLIRVNYDIGNSAALGFDPAEELKLLGPRLGSVHVKDRVLGGATVPLGTGNADFATCFRLISESGFDRWFILQAAREDGLDEAELAAQNRHFVENTIQSVSKGSSPTAKGI
jgi:L-ribulose-5-phosphate 3-epimerase